MTDDGATALAELIRDYVRGDPLSPGTSKIDWVMGHVRRMIEEGHFAPGFRLPTTRQLAQSYEAADVRVSKQWCQEAYRRLRTAGLVTADPGNPRGGTVVVDAPRASVPRGTVAARRDDRGYYFDDFSRTMRLVAHHGVTKRRAPQEIAALLGGEQDVIVRTRVMGRYAEPEQLSQTWIPLSVVQQVPILGSEDTGPGGVEDRIEERFGRLVWEYYELATVAEADDAEKLGVQVGGPLLLEAIVTVIGDHQWPACVTTRAMDGRRYKRGPTRLVRRGSARWPVQPATADPSQPGLSGSDR